mmetsp:Transcript_37370/g.78810  ORF Transcript_37370/g.78810 Transcript_37370/m.78810 type:complete len:321 (+) Transcript_37370:126-1088(+)
MLPLPSLSFLLLACDTRRAFLGGATATCATILSTGPPTAAIAVDDASSELYLARPMGVAKDGSSSDAVIRPSAPLEYLLPAARVGVYLYQTTAMAEDLAELIKDGERTKIDATIQTLDNLLVTSPSFIASKDPTVTRGDAYGNLPPLVGEVAMQQQKQKERKQQSIEVGFAPQFFEVGELIGERRAWNRIVRAESSRENASEVRRALNIYTTNLNFNRNKYVYAGSKEEKSKLIREDKLPTATDVIRSDLDARDLYRNVVQTALEDARAEFVYQKKVGFEDVSDLVGLLKDARTGIDKWFSFIPDEDIKEALEVVKQESR